MAAAVARFDPARLFESSALMRGLRFCSVMVALAMPISARACLPWQEMPHDAWRLLTLCGEPQVERQLGNVCVRHEWLCGKSTFKDWFDHWMAQFDEPFVVQEQLGQLIFSGMHEDMAWAMFWAPAAEHKQGFVILLSRLKASSTMEKQ